MVQDEVGWLLETIKANWPGASFPDTLARIDRDEPKILETGERTRSLELEEWNAIGASRTNREATPVGSEYDYRVETTISLRLEGLHADEWGNVASSADFEQLVRYVQHAVSVERSYPTVEDVDQDGIGSVAYHTISPPENETDLSADDRDYFRRDWEYRFIGYANQP